MILNDLKYLWSHVLDRTWEENGGISFLSEQEANRERSLAKECITYGWGNVRAL